MKLSRFIPRLAAAAFVAVAISCGKDADEEAIPVLTLESTAVPSTAGSIKVRIAATASWTLSAEDTETGSEASWVELGKSKSEGSQDVLLSYAANEGDPRSAVIRLKTPAYNITETLFQSGAGSSSAPGWMELPAMDREGLVFLPHDMSGKRYVSRTKSGIRNWSCYYDTEAFVSHWVAYPQNSGLIGSGDLEYVWGYDPLISTDYQVNIIQGSYGGGWTRGHQLPRADRRAYDAMVSTCYATNQTPQDYDFNSDIWGDLEGRVRTWAGRCDTLYVVTGCNVLPEYGWTGTLSGNKGGHSARVPSHYYKALLRRTKSNTWSAVGFYFPHSSSIASDEFMDYLVSIEELERKTGVTFFVNYAATFGEDAARTLKSNTSTSGW